MFKYKIHRQIAYWQWRSANKTAKIFHCLLA